MEIWKLFEIGDNVDVALLGTDKEYYVKDIWFKIKRNTIPEAIFEAKLSERSNCEMNDGNIYILSAFISNSIYIYCKDEYMYIAATIIEK